MQVYGLTSHSDVKPSLVPSVIFHVSIVLFLGFKAFMIPEQTLEYIPSVRVDIIDLPDKITSAEIPQTPAKESPKESAAEKPKEKAKEIEKPKAEEKVVLNEKSKEKPKADTSKSIDRIKQMIEAENKAKVPKEEVLPTPAFKGNRISPGSSLKGIQQLDFNNYQDSIYTHAKKHWEIPRWLSDSNLNASILITIDEKGFVTKKKIVRSSGDASYDQSVLSAIDKASPFPPPEDKFVDLLSVSGVQITFKP
jgi:TonB family protein